MMIAPTDGPRMVPMPIVDRISDLIGGTPLLRLSHLAPAGTEILGKAEFLNPGGSVKDRICLNMIETAEREGKLKPGATIIEPTSGNTGIALAFVGAARGYPVTLLMPETMSLERRKILKMLGAKLILTDGAQGMAASIERAEEMVAADPDRFVLLQQFKNPANPEIHVKTTGPEIFHDTDGNVDAIVAEVRSKVTSGSTTCIALSSPR